MKERPIVFSGEMVKAILEGRKTQTRRVVKWPVGTYVYGTNQFPMVELKGIWWLAPEYICPYGQPGDRLWVKETWQPSPEAGMVYPEISIPSDSIYYAAYCSPEEYQDSKPWKSGRFMPRWASRITLEVVKVRVERVQEISRDEAFCEGIEAVNPYAIAPDLPPGFPAAFKDYLDKTNFFTADPVASFRSLWNSINDKRGYGWEVNPWVWVIEFRKVN